ncbi:putative esterase B1-like [Sesbania bispinosa]|nr:putative esterase B1-like [Sesbania bispinosa]
MPFCNIQRPTASPFYRQSGSDSNTFSLFRVQERLLLCAIPFCDVQQPTASSFYSSSCVLPFLRPFSLLRSTGSDAFSLLCSTKKYSLVFCYKCLDFVSVVIV